MSIIKQLSDAKNYSEWSSIVKNAKECMSPVVCNGKWMSIMESVAVSSGSQYVPGAIACPVYGSELCRLSKAETSAQVEKFCAHIGHQEKPFVGALKAPKKTTALVELAKKSANAIFLCGPTGSGKDVAIAYRLYKRAYGSRPIFWYSSFQLVREIAESNKLLARLKSARNPVLVIEDLGCESERAAYGQGESAAMVTEAFNAVYQADGEVFGSTNLTREDIEARYGSRLASRLSVADWITIPGNEPDLRKVK